MKGLPQWKPVEQREQFAGFAAADVGLGRHAVLRDAREAAERTQRVLADHRLERERVAVDVESTEGAGAVNCVAARRHHDLGKLVLVLHEPDLEVGHACRNRETGLDHGFKTRRFHAQRVVAIRHRADRKAPVRPRPVGSAQRNELQARARNGPAVLGAQDAAADRARCRAVPGGNHGIQVGAHDGQREAVRGQDLARDHQAIAGRRFRRHGQRWRSNSEL